jgi:hypothetical protein
MMPTKVDQDIKFCSGVGQGMTLWCKDCRKFGTEYVPKSSSLRDDFQLVSVFISLCIIIPSSLGLMNKLHQ